MKFNKKFMVIKNENITNALDYSEQEQLFHLINEINNRTYKQPGFLRAGFNPNSYFVINTDETYAKEVAEILERHGHCARDDDKGVFEFHGEAE